MPRETLQSLRDRLEEVKRDHSLLAEYFYASRRPTDTRWYRRASNNIDGARGVVEGYGLDRASGGVIVLNNGMLRWFEEYRRLLHDHLASGGLGPVDLWAVQVLDTWAGEVAQAHQGGTTK